MVEGLYGELDPARVRELDDHLSGCADCAALYAGMRATLATMRRRRRPDPGTEFWDGYWQRLEERVAREAREGSAADASRFARRRSIGSWGYRAAAAVVVLAAGVWIGRTVLGPAPRTDEPAPGTALVAPGQPDERAPVSEPREDAGAPADATAEEETRVAARAGAIDAPPVETRERDVAPVAVAVGANEDALRYIGRSQVVLLALLNAGNGDAQPASFGGEQAQARLLVAEGERVRAELSRPEDRRLRELVAQLEMILREIANLEADGDLEAVEMIRSRVDREGVLLRIDLQQMRGASAPAARAHEEGNAID
jgi:hypothetical protein